MERLLRNFLVLTSVIALTGQAFARNDWEDWFRRLSKPQKSLVLTSTREVLPSLKVTPKLISFRGAVKVPSYMHLTSGSPLIHNSAGELIIDGHIVCNYSPRSNHDRYYVFKECSDGSRSGDKVEVQNKIEVKLNYASSNKASLKATVSVLRKDESEYGINFPYIQAEEGQILMYNGEAWIAADVSELALDGVAGEKGDQGEIGPQGPAGATGVAGADGAKGEKGDKGDAGVAGVKGDKGDKGDAGVAGAAGSIGPQGPVGATGAIGPQGPVGATGAIGPQGPAGATGALGPQGPAGATGAIGPQGPAGATGAIGPQGPAGATGAIGPQGPAGATGAIGPQGPAGAQGSDGVKGEKGEKGDRGLSEIAYLRDERVSGQHGGTCSSAGMWQTRSLNILGGDIGFISLNGNRFTLQPGKYFIEASMPAYQVDRHQAKLKVIETGADVMIGSSVVSAAAYPNTSHSVISGEIEVIQTSTFEIQHRCQSDRVTIGFGMAANFGTVEIYTQVKIIKKQ